LLEDAQISFFCAYLLIYMGNFGYKYQSCGFLHHILGLDQPEHCSYSPFTTKKQILIANDLCAAKYYLSG